MRYWLSVLLVFSFSGAVWAQGLDQMPPFEEWLQENLEFNQTVTDQEIEDWFLLFLKYLPEELAKFRGQTPDERKAFLLKYRHANNEAKMQIPTLRGLGEHELEKMEQIAKWQAEQSIIAADANSRLRNYTIGEYKVILEVCAKLINEYDASDVGLSGYQTIQDEFPAELAFIKPRLIYVMASGCVIFLQKGIGRGIGYRISLTGTGDASIAWFNDYEGWGETTIDLTESDASGNE